jgi:hypothetical protein
MMGSRTRGIVAAVLSGILMPCSAFHSSLVSARRSKPSNTQLFAVKFSKYEGLGNDFILIDDRDRVDPSLTPEQCIKLCHRNFGIGGDSITAP